MFATPTPTTPPHTSRQFFLGLLLPLLILGVTTVVGLVLGLVYHPRIWCMFCPMGTMANWLGRARLPLAVSEDCVSSGACVTVCRMQINPGSYRDQGRVTHGDCLKCSYCVAVCPQQALSFSRQAGGTRS